MTDTHEHDTETHAAEPSATPDTPQALLDAYFAERRTAVTETVDDTPQGLAHWLRERDGLGTTDEASAAGFSDRLLAKVLIGPTGDGRQRPKVRGQDIGGVRWLWLTAGGWALAGLPNRREAPPTASVVRHRTAPRRFEEWVTNRVAPIAGAQGIDVVVARGEAVRKYVDTTGKNRAWKWLLNPGGRIDDAGELTQGGPLPDALLVETWPEEGIPFRTDYLYPHTQSREGQCTYYSQTRDTPDWTVAVEVELAAKADALTAAKVRRHNIAIGCGWWDAVLWVTDSAAVARRVARAVAFTERQGDSEHGQGITHRHLFVHPLEVGIEGTPTMVTPTTWRWAPVVHSGHTLDHFITAHATASQPPQTNRWPAG